MSILILLDTCLSPRAKEHLTNAGYDVKWVRDIQAKMPDEDVLRLAY
jgi:hypothetical protein